MKSEEFDRGAIDIAWCPGCGDFAILDIVKESFSELGIKPEALVLVSGIGQAAKLPHYLRANFFNGLHGRALPPAVAIKAANPALTVVVTSGDGDMYGEGGNHFMHTIRRNPDITVLVHDNMVYGLTKGQASPTSARGFKSPVQADGSRSEPFNPLAVAIGLNASFVARAYCGDKPNAKEIVKKAISHKGFSIVDIFQPCVTFNKINTYKWFKDNTYYLEESHDPNDRVAAFKRSIETEKLPLGIFYTAPPRPTFEENLGLYSENKNPLYMRIGDVVDKLDKLSI